MLTLEFPPDGPLFTHLGTSYGSLHVEPSFRPRQLGGSKVGGCKVGGCKVGGCKVGGCKVGGCKVGGFLVGAFVEGFFGGLRQLSPVLPYFKIKEL